MPALEIAPGAAFGAGDHPTTAGILTLMVRWDEQGFKPAHVLDVGCGSGILSIAAAHLWPECQVLAADCDIAAVEATRANAETNRVSDRVRAIQSNGYRHPTIAQTAPYDLILCNILAEPLIAWAPDMASVLSAQGMGILSGILLWYEDPVKQAYEANGMEVATLAAADEWRVLAVRHSA